jgi:hypothetical protein
VQDLIWPGLESDEIMGVQHCCQRKRLLPSDEVAQASREVYDSKLMKFEWDPTKAATNKLKKVFPLVRPQLSLVILWLSPMLIPIIQQTSTGS